MTDAIVVGAGHNGLVAANDLADAGWEVLVLEATSEPGGAVRSAELTLPGYVHDVFSAFYPLGVASPVLRRLDLERHGVRWRRAPLVVAHPTDAGSALLSTDLDETAASLDGFAKGDGDTWRELYRQWEDVGDDILHALFRPFPPIVPAGKIALRLRRDLVRFARFALLPVRTLSDERFEGEGGGLLLGGNALHSDLGPESVLSGFFGWLLASLGQQLGFPVPEGGAANLTRALVRRLEKRGGRIVCNMPVKKVIVRDGRAVGVETADGTEIEARRAVLADVPAPSLFLDLVGAEHLPRRVAEDVSRFQWDHATIKVDWALSEPIPWRDEAVRRAGTVHVSRSFDHLTDVSADLAVGRVPRHPFLVMGQLAAADPTRSPAGTETAWAYIHVPRRVRPTGSDDVQGTWDERDRDEIVRRIEGEIEHQAPGFRDAIAARHVMLPTDFPTRNPSLVGGAVNGGTAQLYQQLIFRPTPGLARPETPIKRLYLASSSAHPGGGVHGAPGANAARAALLWSDARRKTLAAAALAGAVAVAARRR